MSLNENEILSYINEVNLLLKNAYVPYSQFPVAALLIDDNGHKHKGVNVENATNNENKIYEATLENLNFFEKKDEIRLIGVQLSSILKNNVVQLSFNDLK